MQDQYFNIALGKWTNAIDWTAAVMNTHISGVLSSLSRSLNDTTPETLSYLNNEIATYFDQSMAFFYGENAFDIRFQAYDDMLWVVLEWLESISFIESHSTAMGGKWHGQQFIPAFAHRARIFYELAEKGWDWQICGGGMTWNPHLRPYKNAITNQLFISASIKMYLHFPGDKNCSPFSSSKEQAAECVEKLCNQKWGDCNEGYMSARSRYNPVYKANAINGYKWLKKSGMLNKQGLYIDGLHSRQSSKDNRCDERNEMVYTYNQGVVLSGLRGLWEATGDVNYLDDGYKLITSVIRATGWDEENRDSKWHGLGSNGILAELCDPSASCNQDAQTFKGIFFHHVTAFCELLPRTTNKSGSTHGAPAWVATRHQRVCSTYTAWVAHNAQAALATRNADGQFGAYWGVPYKSETPIEAPTPRLPSGATDYRNTLNVLALIMRIQDLIPRATDDRNTKFYEYILKRRDRVRSRANTVDSSDLNDRGRGRTVETQGSGVAVVRAMFEFMRRGEVVL
jgi:hypothetical protein